MDVVELFRDISTYNSEFNHNTSDSMKFMGQGELPPPASCFICGSGNCEAGYLYTGTWAEMVGNLSICMTCLTIGGEKAGFLVPSVKALFEKNIGELQEYAKGLELTLEKANEQLAAYRVLLPGITPVAADSVDALPTPAPRKRPADAPKSVPAKSSESQKPKRVADITADDVAKDSPTIL